jgi:hypothetical protein
VGAQDPFDGRRLAVHLVHKQLIPPVQAHVPIAAARTWPIDLLPSEGLQLREPLLPLSLLVLTIDALATLFVPKPPGLIEFCSSLIILPGQPKRFVSQAQWRSVFFARGVVCNGGRRQAAVHAALL